MKDAYILDLYTDYLMASFNLTTATGMSAMLDGAISHDQISRFLSQGLLDQKNYWKYIKRIVRRIEYDYGINIINFLYENKLYSECISIPLAFELIKKTEQYFDKKANKVKRRSPVSLSKHSIG